MKKVKILGALMLFGLITLTSPSFANKQCTYGGDTYDHGSVISQPDGPTICEDGEWENY